MCARALQARIQSLIGAASICHLDRVRIVRVRRLAYEIQCSTHWHDSTWIEEAAFDADVLAVHARRRKNKNEPSRSNNEKLHLTRKYVCVGLALYHVRDAPSRLDHVWPELFFAVEKQGAAKNMNRRTRLLYTDEK